MIEFALEHPDMATALVLESPEVGGYRPAGNMPAALAELLVTLRGGDVRRASEIAVRLWVDGPRRTPEQVDARIRSRVGEMSRTALLNVFVEEEPLSPPAVQRLESLKIPTLVIVGELDHPEVLALAKFLRSHLAGAREAVVSGAAHLANMEKPEDFNSTVLGFLSRAKA